MALGPLVTATQKEDNDTLKATINALDPLESFTNTVLQTLNEVAPVSVNKGQVIAEKVDPELDELRQLLNEGKSFLDQMLTREMEATGIPSLKIAFNNVFGYYIEVRNTHKDKVPGELDPQTNFGFCRTLYYRRAQNLRNKNFRRRRTHSKLRTETL